MNRGASISYEKTLKIAASIASLFLWGLSMYFSSSGFGDKIAPDKQWLGYALAGCFTVLQLVWNRMRGNNSNLTIWFFGIFVYIYSIVTDIIGFSAWMGYTSLMSAPILMIAVILAVSFGMEVVPEPLIIWSWTGSFSEGGFLDNLFGKDKDEDQPSYPISGRKFPKENSHPSMGYNTQPPMAKKNNTRDLISKRVSGRDLRPAMPLRNLNESRRDEEDDEEDMPTFLKSNRR